MTINIDQNELIGIIAEKLSVDKSNIMINVHKFYHNGLERFEAGIHVDTNKSYDDDDCEQCVVND
jgi:hypothetical protein